MKAKRYDFRKLEKARKLDNGFLKAPVFATRTGVFKYMKGDGTIIREYRPPQEVFSKDSLESLAGVPVTNRHPKGLVNSKNAKELTVGFTSDIVVREDTFVKTSVTISDEAMIQEIERDGIEEVSCGYICDLEFTQGVTPEGEHFDAIQKNIEYNHLAVVDRGRAGPNVKLHLDAEDAILDDGNYRNDLNNPMREENNMKTATIKLDGIEYTVDSAVAAPIQTALAKAHADGMKKGKEEEDEKKAKDMKEKMDEAQAKIDALTEDLKKAQEAKMDEKELNSLVAKKADFWSKVKPVFGSEDEVKLDEMTDLEIMTAVLEKKCDGIDLKDKSEAYIQGRFDHVMGEVANKTSKSDDAIKKALAAKAKGEEIHADNKEMNAEEVRAAKMKADSQAWTKPIGFSVNK